MCRKLNTLNGTQRSINDHMILLLDNIMNQMQLITLYFYKINSNKI